MKYILTRKEIIECMEDYGVLDWNPEIYGILVNALLAKKEPKIKKGCKNCSRFYDCGMRQEKGVTLCSDYKSLPKPKESKCECNCHERGTKLNPCALCGCQSSKPFEIEELEVKGRNNACTSLDESLLGITDKINEIITYLKSK